ANLALVQAGLVVLAFGNASSVDRAADVMAIKPSGVPYGELTVESMVLVGLTHGEVLGGGLRPSSDTATHLVLYRRFEAIGGVVHPHPAAAAAWAQAGRPIPCLGTTHADHFHGTVPVTRDMTTDEIREGYESATGSLIVETIEELALDPLEMPAVLVRSH